MTSSCRSYAYLAKGAQFIPEPLVQYRAHGGNASHSLAAERATNPVDRLLADEHIHYVHLGHSLQMDDELIRLSDSDPNRFGPIAQRIRPLLAVQQTTMAHRLVKTRAALRELGVKRFGPAKPQA